MVTKPRTVPLLPMTAARLGGGRTRRGRGVASGVSRLNFVTACRALRGNGAVQSMRPRLGVRTELGVAGSKDKGDLDLLTEAPCRSRRRSWTFGRCPADDEVGSFVPYAEELVAVGARDEAAGEVVAVLSGVEEKHVANLRASEVVAV
ncbi:hypothetical protein [Streptomyces sp. TN58]|uniref:hypothetical protein n=1 Tax=Streptomyces sp. TN58 TaxID=234612 RepID=UPI00133181E3|nr:hypothetical protein [Streptomyces sp. TN58]